MFITFLSCHFLSLTWADLTYLLCCRHYNIRPFFFLWTFNVLFTIFSKIQNTSSMKMRLTRLASTLFVAQNLYYFFLNFVTLLVLFTCCQMHEHFFTTSYCFLVFFLNPIILNVYKLTNCLVIFISLNVIMMIISISIPTVVK